MIDRCEAFEALTRTWLPRFSVAPGFGACETTVSTGSCDGTYLTSVTSPAARRWVEPCQGVRARPGRDPSAVTIRATPPQQEVGAARRR